MYSLPHKTHTKYIRFASSFSRGEKEREREKERKHRVPFVLSRRFVRVVLLLRVFASLREAYSYLYALNSGGREDKNLCVSCVCVCQRIRFCGWCAHHIIIATNGLFFLSRTLTRVAARHRRRTKKKSKEAEAREQHRHRHHHVDD